MPHEQMSFMRISGFDVVAAFGLLTMSSNLSDASVTSVNMKPDYFYEAPGTIDYIIEYNASTKHHFDMFTLDSNGTKIDEVIYDVPETTDLATFNTEVKQYFEHADLIIATVGGSVAIKLE